MNKENECYAYFTVAGTIDPDELTRRVRVIPTDCWHKGDIDQNGRTRTFSRWSLRSRLAKSAPLDSHIADVLEQLDANPEGFREISIEEGGVMQLVAYFHSIGCGMSLDSDVIQRMAAYKLSMDCDFYYLRSDRREDTD